MNLPFRSAGLRPAAAAPRWASAKVHSPIRPARRLRLSEPRSASRLHLLAGLALSALGLSGVHAGAGGWSLATNLTLKADVALKETYDSNVYLQDEEPNRAVVPQAVSPFVESFVTSFTPRLSLDCRPADAFHATLSYAPEVVFFHSASSEDHVAHRGTLNLGGQIEKVRWDFPNTLNIVQGSREGLYFGGDPLAPPPTGGNAPAIGGVPIRDRRAQLVYRCAPRVTVPLGRWFVRPALSGYLHDFQTEQKDTTIAANRGYENYVDRRELNAGADLGMDVGRGTRAFVGYRYGQEIEGDLVGSPYHYDTEYHRPTFGLEGQPFRWVKANLSVGPDIHHTIHNPAPGFEPNYTTVWADAVLTLLPTTNDTLTLTWKQNTQPAFASTSVYDDIVYDFAGRHVFNPHWSVGAAFRIYIGDWFAPVDRTDWIYTPSVTVGYVHDRHWAADLGYSYDWVDSKVPDTDGREFTRHLVWLSVKYAF